MKFLTNHDWAPVMIRFLYASVFLMLSLSLSVVAFEPDKNATVELSPSEKGKFEEISCQKFVGVGMDSIRAQRHHTSQDLTDVFVTCKPHNKLDDHPLRMALSCRPIEKNWKCDFPSLQVVEELSEKTIIISSDPDEIYEAVEAVKHLNKLGKFAGGNFLKGSPEENLCSVNEFKNSNWSVQCNESWGFDLKQVCEGDECKWDVVNEGQVLH
jgi:hypothetical protein